jgi:hypothetical protein
MLRWMLMVFVVFQGCTSVKQIGKVNMVSNRNVETDFEYVLLSSYAGSSDKELKRSKAESVEQAIDDTVRKVPGGEFMMNVSMYVINNDRFAVVGDVWGRTENVAYRGFRVGDRVTFKRGGKVVYGQITGLKDDKTCFVQPDGDEAGVEVAYDELAKGQ